MALAERGWIKATCCLVGLTGSAFFTLQALLNIRGICTAGNPLNWRYVSAGDIINKLNLDGSVKPTSITTYKAGPSAQPPKAIDGTIEITHRLAGADVSGDQRDPSSIWLAAAGKQRFLIEAKITWMPTAHTSLKYFYVSNCPD